VLGFEWLWPTGELEVLTIHLDRPAPPTIPHDRATTIPQRTSYPYPPRLLSLVIQGDGTTTDAWTTPVSVVGLPEGNVTSISVGDLHACAVIDGRNDNNYANSTAWCWGRNAVGQLGDSTTTDRSVAVKVKNLAANVTAVQVGQGLNGAGFTCALLAQGSVKCWGHGTYGSRGDGSSVESQSTPVSVQGLEDVVVTQLSLGYYFALALTSDGDVYGWGINDYYQLGDGTSTNRATAVEASSIANGYMVSSVSAGYRHASFSEADGRLVSWGQGSYGEFANGASSSSSGSADLFVATGYDVIPPTSVPTPVPTKSDQVSLAVSIEMDGVDPNNITTADYAAIKVGIAATIDGVEASNIDGLVW
jgi:alpha-tubulin suppressor-like RCC1 family protein